MSLHQLANHMSAQGRGPDSTLVHMSPREVSGLQSLAMANGGTLTINPQTGLPEAGFLDSLLPTLLGGAATFFSGGTITPLMAAMGVGGLTALTSKDLGKGLMAGLGAYGGSGIMEGLEGFGANAIGAEAATAALPSGASSVSGDYDLLQAQASNAAQKGASYSDRLSRGVTEGFKNPMGALSAIGGGNKFMGALKVGAPLLSALSSQDQTSVPTPEQIKFDPSYANINIRRDQLPYQRDTGSSAQRGYFGPTYVNRNAAEGGFVSDDGIEHFGAGGRTGRVSTGMPITRTPADLVNLGNRGSKRFTPVNRQEFAYPSEIGKIGKDSLPPGLRSALVGSMPNVNPSGYANPASSAQRSNTFVEKPTVQQPIQAPPQQPIQPITQRPTEPIAPIQQTRPVEPTPQRPIEPTQPTQPSQRPVNERVIVPAPQQPAPQQPIQPITQQPMEPTRPVAQQPVEPPRPQQPMEPTQPTQRRIDETGMVPKQVVENPVIVPRLEGGRDSAAKGGLMALAVGGGIPLDPDYDYSGYGRKKTDVVRPVTPMPDVPKPDFLAADGKTYRYDPIKKSWYVIKEAEEKVNPGVKTLMDGDGGPGGGQDNAPGPGPGGGYGIPGATMSGGISGPTTGLASGANSLAATLGNMSSNREPGIVSRALRGISDTLAANVDPSFSHEGRTGKTSPTGGGFTLGPDGLTSMQTQGIQAANPMSQDPAQAQAQAQAEAQAAVNGRPGGGDVAEGNRGGYDVGNAPSGDNAKGGMIGHYSQGGLGSLGGYSDGGRLLRGPGDGVSDSIPATVGDRQPARLADGEFVVPARIVSELGNGSTEAGARALYKMMDRIQANRRKTTGKNSVAVNSKSHKYLPA